MSAVVLRRYPGLVDAVRASRVVVGSARRNPRDHTWTVDVPGKPVVYRRWEWTAVRVLRRLVYQALTETAQESCGIRTYRWDLEDRLASRTGRRWPW